jgi:tetratricopeptide (TPR) repeat protein
MENSESLIRKARALESAGQDEGALACYVQALTGTQQPDANLLARAGVLQLRLGRVDEAAETLTRAADLYSGAGLRNNALALCHRVLRVDAGRPDFLRRAGELSAAQGYRDDARRAYLELASRLDADVAAAALRDYLRHFPADPAVKDRLFTLTGEESASAPAAATEARSATDDFGLVAGLGDDEPLPGIPPEARGARESDPGTGLLEGLEPTHAGDRWSPGSGTADDSLGLLDNALDLPPARRSESEAPSEDRHDSDEVADESAEEGEGDPLPLLSLGPEPSPSSPPPLSTAREAEAPPEDPVPALRERIAREPADLGAHAELVEHLALAFDPSLEDALAAAHAAFGAAGRHAEAADFAERLTVLRPDDAGVLQAWAEHAFRSGDRARLVAAYLAVARRFADSGQTAPARKIYERVLKLEPGNQQARDGARVPDGAQPDDAGFVDLGAMVLDEKGSTRFQVEASFPTGDEEEDFREILAAFREQITAGIDAADSSSHYDLGIAFKEMGLWDDAVTQLQRALRAGSAPLGTLEVLGECYYQKGDHELAARMLDRAAQLPGRSESELAGVQYWLGRAHEALGASGAARESYLRVVAVDPDFRDAATRLDGLGAG